MRFAFPSHLELAKLGVSRALSLVAAAARQGQPATGPAAAWAGVDATCGNGHDTLFLAKAMQGAFSATPWQVLAFDIQEKALHATRARMAEQGFAQHLSLHGQGHETAAKHLAPNMHLCIAMFNLGYLPGSDKTITTRQPSTMQAITTLAAKLVPLGLMSLHTYGGHEGGTEEMDAVEAWCEALPCPAWRVVRYACCNKQYHPETLFLAQKMEA